MFSFYAQWIATAMILMMLTKCGMAQFTLDESYGLLLQSDLPEVEPIVIASSYVKPLIRIPRTVEGAETSISEAEERSDDDQVGDALTTVTSMLPTIIDTFSSPTPSPYSSTLEGADLQRSGAHGGYISRPSKLIVTVKSGQGKGKGKGGGYGGHGVGYGNSGIGFGHSIGGYDYGTVGLGHGGGYGHSSGGYGKGKGGFGGHGKGKGGIGGYGKGSFGGYGKGKGGYGKGKGGHGAIPIVYDSGHLLGHGGYDHGGYDVGHGGYDHGHGGYSSGKGDDKGKGYTGYGAKRFKQIKNLFKSVYDDITGLKKSDLEYKKASKAHDKGTKGEQYQEIVITPVYEHGYGGFGAADGYDHGFSHHGGFDDHFDGHGFHDGGFGGSGYHGSGFGGSGFHGSGFGDSGFHDSGFGGHGGGYGKGKVTSIGKGHGGFVHGHFGGDSYDRLSFKSTAYKGPKLGPYDFFPEHKGYLTKSGKIGTDPVKEKKHSYEKALAHFGGFGGGGNRYGPGLKGYSYLIDHIDGPKPHHGYDHKDVHFTPHKVKVKGHGGGGYGHHGGGFDHFGGGFGHHDVGYGHHGGGHGHHGGGYGKGKDKDKGYGSFFKGLFSGKGKGGGYDSHGKVKHKGGYDSHGHGGYGGHGHSGYGKGKGHGGYDSHGKGKGHGGYDVKGFSLFKGKGHGGYDDHHDPYHGGYDSHGKGKGIFSKGKVHHKGGGYDEHSFGYHRRAAVEHQGEYSHRTPSLTGTSSSSQAPKKVHDSSKIDYSVSFHDAQHKVPVYIPNKQ